jgi:hypothetical protein
MNAVNSVVNMLDKFFESLFEKIMKWFKSYFDKNEEIIEFIFAKNGILFYVIGILYVIVVAKAEEYFGGRGEVVLSLVLYIVILWMLTCVLTIEYYQPGIKRKRILEPVVDGLVKLSFAVLGFIPVFLISIICRIFSFFRNLKLCAFSI